MKRGREYERASGPCKRKLDHLLIKLLDWRNQARVASTASTPPIWQATVNSIGRQQISQSSMVE